MTAPPTTARTGRYGTHLRASGAGLELWVYDQIDAEFGVNAGDLVRQVRAAGRVPVTVRIDSPGGDVFSSLALYECLRTHPGRVTIYVDGHAASAASVIAMGGDDVAIAPGGMVFVHDTLKWTGGNEADHLAAAKLLGQVSDAIAAIYAGRTGGTTAAWRTTTRQERWFTASEAVSAGLVDRIVDVPAPVSAVARGHRVTARQHRRPRSRRWCGRRCVPAFRARRCPGWWRSHRVVLLAAPSAVVRHRRCCRCCAR